MKLPYAAALAAAAVLAPFSAFAQTPPVKAPDDTAPAPAPAPAAAPGRAAAPAAARRAEVANMEPAVNVGAAPRPSGAAAPRVARARDTVDLGTTSITGNQELPKVLYIVPWKRSDLGDLVGPPANTLLDEVLAPVDPEEFERHLSYYQILYGDSSSGASAAGRSEEE